LSSLSICFSLLFVEIGQGKIKLGSRLHNFGCMFSWVNSILLSLLCFTLCSFCFFCLSFSCTFLFYCVGPWISSYWKKEKKVQVGEHCWAVSVACLVEWIQYSYHYFALPFVLFYSKASPFLRVHWKKKKKKKEMGLFLFFPPSIFIYTTLHGGFFVLIVRKCRLYRENKSNEALCIFMFVLVFPSSWGFCCC
jgi:hypothetical protein